MKKVLLISGIVVLVIILIGGIFIYANKSKLSGFVVEKSFGTMESMILMNLSQSIPRDSVRTVFNKAVDKVKMGKVNEIELQRVISTFQTSFSDKKLDSLEALNLFEGIKQLAGSGQRSKNMK